MQTSVEAGPSRELPGGSPSVVGGASGGPRGLTRALAGAGAVALMAVAFGHPAFRTSEGALSPLFCIPLSLAGVTLLVGMAAGTAWRSTAWWLALAIVGQTAALGLTDAGNLLGYQHYPPPWLLEGVLDVAMLAVLGVQALAVLIWGGDRLRRWGASVTRRVGPIRPAIVVAGVVLSSAALSADMAAYATELVLATVVQLLQLGTVCLAVAAAPTPAADAFGAWAGASGGRGPRVDRIAVAAAAFAALASAALAWFVYEAHPHVPDEVVYLYHARYFAAGMLSMPLPAVPEAFNLDLMTYEAARWYSPVPPGWPAMLAVGAYLGAAWLVNPVLNGVNVLLAYVLLRDVYDVRIARVAILLLCVSPWFVFMGMNFMTHTFTLTCALAAAAAVMRLRRSGSFLWAVPGGVCVGVLGLIRPLEGVTVAVLLGFWGLGQWPWRAARFARVSVLAVVAMATASLTLPYNAELSGDPLTFPLMAYTDSVYGPGSNDLGFGPEKGLGWSGLDPFPGHGVRDVAVNAALNTYSVNVELLGWSAGSIVALLLLFLVGGRLTRADWWMLVVIGAVVGVHALYWFSGGPDFGARYWYLILVPCIALVARAPVLLAERFADGAAAVQRLHGRLLLAMACLSISAVLCFFPWRATDKYHNYRNMRPDVRQLAAAHDFGRSVVLVQGARRFDYASAAIYNPLDLHADEPIYIWDNDPRITREALRGYEDRSVWIIAAPPATGAGFRLVEGPLHAREVMDRLDAGQ